jgi:poly-gamma-glutamate capsule biosynthesis protein CapA/YwtB (metallophosphatase superfamily)
MTTFLFRAWVSFNHVVAPVSLRRCDDRAWHIHWGGNWGYEIPQQQIAFAHRLIEEGIAIVHGHSSHHVKALEVFKGSLILHGCGDFLTDYEGISGNENFRGDLGLSYSVEIDSQSGDLMSARFVPMQIRPFRLEHTSVIDARWLCDHLNQLSETFGTRVRLGEDNSLMLRWQ